jgi:hypothetical protein
MHFFLLVIVGCVAIWAVMITWTLLFGSGGPRTGRGIGWWRATAGLRKAEREAARHGRAQRRAQTPTRVWGTLRRMVTARPRPWRWLLVALFLSAGATSVVETGSSSFAVFT